MKLSSKIIIFRLIFFILFVVDDLPFHIPDCNIFLYQGFSTNICLRLASHKNYLIIPEVRKNYKKYVLIFNQAKIYNDCIQACTTERIMGLKNIDLV